MNGVVNESVFLVIDSRSAIPKDGREFIRELIPCGGHHVPGHIGRNGPAHQTPTGKVKLRRDGVARLQPDDRISPGFLVRQGDAGENARTIEIELVLERIESEAGKSVDTGLRCLDKPISEDADSRT